MINSTPEESNIFFARIHWQVLLGFTSQTTGWSLPDHVSDLKRRLVQISTGEKALFPAEPSMTAEQAKARVREVLEPYEIDLEKSRDNLRNESLRKRYKIAQPDQGNSLER